MSITNISVQSSATRSCWTPRGSTNHRTGLVIDHYDDDISKSEAQREGLFATLLHSTAVNGNKGLLQKLLQEVAGRNDEINRGDQFGRTPLVYSVLGDRLDCAELLIKYGASICMSDVDGRTPLHWAAYQGNHKCVKLLLSKGADWKAKDTKGRTPLHFAASPHSAKCLSILLKKAPKGEVDEPDNDAMTALHWGASYGNSEHVKLLLKAKASVKLLDVEKKTPLHWGATNPNPGVVKLVLEQSNEIINWQDTEGRTALHHAVAQQNEAVVKSLLSINECDVSVQDNMYRTPLHWVAVLGNSRIVKLLLRKTADHSLRDGNGATALHYAAQGDDFKTIEAFLHFCDVKDSTDNEGRTALMWAARKGASMALETMLRHNIDVHATDKSGRTALHVAAYSGDIKCVEILLNHGASVNALDEMNHSPLFRACEMGYIDVVNMLMKNNATLDLEDQDGRSLLHWAALNGHAHICLTLIQNGLSSNKGDKFGCTPLHCAAYGGFVNCMSVLIDSGADVNNLDKEGISPLHWSCSSGHLEAVKLLLRNRAFPNFMKKDAERLTPLDFAIFGDHQDIAQYMIEQGGLTITAIQDVAATTIQSCWRGYRIRKPFQTRKDLYMRHEQLKKDMLMKRRGSFAARDDEVRDRLALINNPGLITGPVLVSDEQKQESSPLLQIYQEENEELQQRDSMEFRDSSDYYLASLASQRYSFSEYQDEKEGSQLSTILESSHSLNTSASGETDDGVCENRIKKIVHGDKKTSNESTDLSKEKDEQSFEKDKHSKTKSNLNKDVDNVLETLAQCNAPPSHSKTENDEQKCRKYQSNSNIKQTDAQKNPSFPKRIQALTKYEIANENIPSNFQKQSKTELVRKDRLRRNQIRAKMDAASVIQKWWRRCWDRKCGRHPENMALDESAEQNELVQQVAVLTIQLGWRKYLRQKCQEHGDRQLNKVAHDSLCSNESTETNLSAIKSSKHRNNVSEKRRPTLAVTANRQSRIDGSMGRLRKTAHFTPSTASCNLALDMKNPIVTKRGNSRTSTPRRGGNNKVRPRTTSRRTKSVWTPAEANNGRKSQRS